MTRRKTTDLNHRLRKLKAALLAVSLTLAGILLMMLNGWIEHLKLGDWEWLRSIPLGELGGTLFGTSLLSTLFEYSFRKEQEEAEEATVEQFRQIIHEQAPAMRDAVVEGFAIYPEDLKRVSNPDLLDDIAANVMSLRLGDEQFAREIYTDIRDQAVRAAERWYDVEVCVRLSSISRLELWNGNTPPFRAVACVDSCAYQTGKNTVIFLDVPATSLWLMQNRPGVDAASRESYELLELTVDGRPQAIRRSIRKTGQTYSVRLDAAACSGKPARIRQVFRVVTPKWGHRLYFELPQPCRRLSLGIDYTNTDIAHLTINDTVATSRAAQITRSPAAVAGKVVSVDMAGWLLPKSGFSATWTLNAELPRDESHREAA